MFEIEYKIYGDSPVCLVYQFCIETLTVDNTKTGSIAYLNKDANKERSGFWLKPPRFISQLPNSVGSLKRTTARIKSMAYIAAFTFGFSLFKSRARRYPAKSTNWKNKRQDAQISAPPPYCGVKIFPTTGWNINVKNAPRNIIS